MLSKHFVSIIVLLPRSLNELHQVLLISLALLEDL